MNEKLQQLNYNFHMSRILILLSFIFTVSQNLISQTFDVFSYNHSDIISINGKYQDRAYTLAFYYNGNDLNIKNLIVKVELTSFPITVVSNSRTYTFPENKLRFILNDVEGPLSKTNMVDNKNAILNGTNVINLIDGINKDIKSSDMPYYYRLSMFFDLDIIGGTYLDELRGLLFNVPLKFTFFSSNKNGNNMIKIAELTHTYRIRVNETLTGNPPQTDVYSIALSQAAVNGQLEFKTMSDYIEGKSVTYVDGITITSNTNYQLKMKTITPNFISITNPAHTIPVDVVKVQLNGNNEVTTPVSLSSIQQTILNGVSTNSQPLKYSIKYFTSPNENRLINALSENTQETFSTTITYEISPR